MARRQNVTLFPVTADATCAGQWHPTNYPRLVWPTSTHRRVEA